MKLKALGTERRNPATENLDTMSTIEFVTAMNHEDAVVPRAIKKVLPEIARAVDVVAQCLAKGGRLIYVGTGTSGRIGALDASECPPTFNTDPEMVQFLIAGGEDALVRPTEASEDSLELGRKDMASRKPGKRDAVVGIAASGRTPYTIAALEYARSKGAKTIAIACNKGSALGKAAEFPIEIEVGPEALTGSSRLKAGTAQKLVCNMLTTGSMTQLGYVYGNLMVNLQLKNEKLVERGILILEYLTGADRTTALKALDTASMSVPLALVMLKADVSKAQAEKRLRKAKGNVRKALEG
ncbi:N-acetylmuramic acid 6-phosphate etherase [Acidicapsa ligni]|uniref:N-acetylmuramic acid 6-phosphate etherase n=1 Tax=Acidicapsa ligni TaxID=542300 RepID=UPI0021DFDB53|nr:N-acetylmuramic acid 6-phosphate etherase [Acidicapsa ligni]